MAYKFQDELTQRAEQFIASLRQAEIDGAIVPNSFRDYTVKVAIRKAGQFFGNANLFYSPTKDRFSLKAHELKDASIVPDMERCWDRIDFPGSTADTNPVGSVPHGLQVYVDGSFIDGKIGYAFVVLQDGTLAHEHWGQVQDNWLLDMRQVGGEIKAVLEAIAWCQDHSIKEAEIFYDYAGLELWATGQWEAKKPATQKYARLAAEWPVAVHWRKIESHTGDHWNERADELAKKGALQQQKETPINQDPMATAQDKAREFIDFLAQQGIAATFKGIMNGQFARIGFPKFAGQMDIYHTKRRPLASPYIYGIANQAHATQIEHLWKEFLATEDTPPPPPDLLAETRYYLQILEPFGDCDFDFVDLDQALQKAFQKLNRPYPAGDLVRHDFTALHDLFVSLKQEEL